VLWGDGVDWLWVTISITIVGCDWWVSILIVPMRSCFLRRPIWGNNFSTGQWRSKPTNHSWPSWYISWHETSQSHRLLKTSRKQPNNRDLELKWQHRQKKNDIHFTITFTTINDNHLFHDSSKNIVHIKWFSSLENMGSFEKRAPGL